RRPLRPDSPPRCGLRAGRCPWVPPPPAPATPPIGLTGEGAWVQLHDGVGGEGERARDVRAYQRRELGALPLPLSGEGWGGGGTHALSFCMPPPCPSPASGGGDAGAA